ncbi:MAG: hypothetical protein V4754_15515 [Pseudomonadota bacterium]
MSHRFIAAVLSLASLTPLCLTACASSSTPLLDQRFGDATRIAFARQIAFPDAAARPRAADGLDGPSAGRAIEQYRKSFEAAPVAPAAGLGFGQ